MSTLPSADREYLLDKGLSFEEHALGDQKALILRKVTLPSGRYDQPSTDVLILLPSGYPDVRPDMFHTLPWVKLVPENRYPKAADQPTSFNGQSWQRWSRHLLPGQWKPGVDSIESYLALVRRELLAARPAAAA